MIFVIGIIILVVFLLSTSGAAGETSVLGIESPIISNTPVGKEPEVYVSPVQEILKQVLEPVSTFLRD